MRDEKRGWGEEIKLRWEQPHLNLGTRSGKWTESWMRQGAPGEIGTQWIPSSLYPGDVNSAMALGLCLWLKEAKQRIHREAVAADSRSTWEGNKGRGQLLF